MKIPSRLTLLLCFLLPLSMAMGQDYKKLPNTDVRTGIDSVKVFFDGAQVYRHANVTVPAGQSTITFKGLSQHILVPTVQPGIEAGPRVISSGVYISYLQQNSYSGDIRRINDSIDLLIRTTATIDAKIKGLEVEKGLLMKNDKLGGQDNGISTADLERAAIFYRERFEKISIDLFDLERKKTELNNLTSRLQLEIRRYHSMSNQPTRDVVVTVESPRAGKVTVQLQYVVGETGWGPRYDIRSGSVDENVQITYMADVYNATGINWENIKMTLSTADPTQSAQVPVLEPWVLNWDRATLAKSMAASEGFLNNAAPSMAEFELEEVVIDADGEAWGDDWTDVPAEAPSSIEVSELSVDYQIKGSYSIPSTDDPFQVTVREEEVKTSYNYTAVPKVQPTAYLIARLTDWERLNLLAGPASIYFGGTYIGDSYIEPRLSNDTLNISLGKDDKVHITRSKMSDFTKKQTIGSNTRETFRYKISLRNTNSSPISITILDQIPISQVSDIEVTANELSGAELTARDGQLRWRQTLPPSGTKNIEFEYEVKYPKNKELILRKTRKLGRTPRFRF